MNKIEITMRTEFLQIFANVLQEPRMEITTTTQYKSPQFTLSQWSNHNPNSYVQDYVYGDGVGSYIQGVP
jgi:hypothetical protein